MYSCHEFELLFKANYRMMYRMAFSVLEDEDDAKDAVGEVFARMWRTKPQIAQESLRGYLLAATRNQSLNILKQRNLQQRIEEEYLQKEQSASEAERHELLDELERVIDNNLTEQDRRILSLRYDEELSYSETAQRLGISIAAVNKHITRSFFKIRKTIKLAKQ